MFYFQNIFQHARHLFLGGVAIAANCFFDLFGHVFSNIELIDHAGSDRDTLCAAQFQHGLYIFPEKRSFNGHLCRLVQANQILYLLEDITQLNGMIVAHMAKGEHPNFNHLDLLLVGINQGKAKHICTWVNAENAGSLQFHGRKVEKIYAKAGGAVQEGVILRRFLSQAYYNSMDSIGILGAGAMGSGIAQVAAAAGHNVIICDNYTLALSKASKNIQASLKKMVEKGRISEADAYSLFSRIKFTDHTSDFRNCPLIIEAIVEDVEQKQICFKSMEAVVAEDAILASNTSSLSIAAMGANLKHPERVIGIHFFNPAQLMRLVEIIPAVQTDPAVVQKARDIVNGWGKTTVLAKDTPGFIVNRVARPYYGEALRILEEGIADLSTIDWAMREIGGFRMGPFELMDFIGNDINYAVTEIVFENFYYDPRYKPSFTQKRLVDAHYFGQKSQRGFYDYRDGAIKPEPQKDPALGQEIVNRILAMLINEAAEALYLNVATRDDIDMAMTNGVNYPKGLLAWADEIGIETVVQRMDNLYVEYLDDRYRCSRLLRKMLRDNKTFY